jgi:hypothetical protein
MPPFISLLRISFNTPASWSAPVVLLALEFAFFFWFPINSVIAAIALLLGGALFLSWPFFVLKSGRLADLSAPSDASESLRRRQMTQLRADLTQAGYQQGLAQLDLLDQKLSSLKEVLRRRLNAGELAQLRYLEATERVFFSALDNLHEIYVALTSVGTIDPKETRMRLADLRGMNDASASTSSEIESLSNRLELLDRQRTKVEALFAQNERAMTTMDHAASALADARMAKGGDAIDIDQALQDLEKMARQTGKLAQTTRS